MFPVILWISFCVSSLCPRSLTGHCFAKLFDSVPQTATVLNPQWNNRLFTSGSLLISLVRIWNDIAWCSCSFFFICNSLITPIAKVTYTSVIFLPYKKHEISWGFSRVIFFSLRVKEVHVLHSKWRCWSGKRFYCYLPTHFPPSLPHCSMTADIVIRVKPGSGEAVFAFSILWNIPGVHFFHPRSYAVCLNWTTALRFVFGYWTNRVFFLTWHPEDNPTLKA